MKNDNLQDFINEKIIENKETTLESNKGDTKDESKNSLTSTNEGNNIQNNIYKEESSFYQIKEVSEKKNEDLKNFYEDKEKEETKICEKTKSKEEIEKESVQKDDQQSLKEIIPKKTQASKKKMKKIKK